MRTPEFQIEITLHDRLNHNLPEVHRVDNLYPSDVARLIGNYAFEIFGVPREINAVVRCVHKDRPS